MRIKDIMDLNPAILNQQSSIKTAYAKLAEDKGVVVTDDGGRPVGLITSAQLFKAIASGLDDSEPVSTIMQRNFSTLGPLENIEIEPNGQKVWPVVEAGRLQGVVTGEILLKHRQSRHEETLVHLELLLRHSLNGILIIDSNGLVRTINQAAETLLGVLACNVLKQPAESFLTDTGLLDILRTGLIQENQRFYINGRTILSNRWPIMRGDKVIGAIAIMQDISKQELLIRDISIFKELNQELDETIEACSEGIYISDERGVGLRVNRSYERITGVKAQELIGKPMSLVVAQGIVSDSVTMRVMDTQSSVTITQQIKGGKEMLVTGTPIFDEKGKIKRVVTTVRDVTQLNELQKKLRETDERSQKYYEELLLLREQQLSKGEVVMTSKAMKQVIEQAAKAAKMDATCLLLGESGVGKDVVARVIYSTSKRRKKAFIKINCGAIPRNLLEAELFGYEAGAFTGAGKNGKPGMFELAHKGTLFLDEIAEIPIDLQVKLLHVLQDMSIYRVGGTKEKKVDVRIIAATNQNIEEMVEQGKFRKDLYYRLNIIPIKISPLRERPEDIVPLIEKMLQQLNIKYGKNKNFTPEVIESMLSYHWPGNVRELRNIVERMFVISSEERIDVENLPQILQEKKNSLQHGLLVSNKLKEAVEDVEKYILTKTIREHKTIRKAASILGVDHSTVSRKIQRYQIPIVYQE